MPTYEYKCTACGHAFEQFQSITAAPVKRCPQCGKAKVKRLVSIGAGVIFKGSGFYITDYRDASYKEKAKAESGATSGGSDSASGSDGKAESKSGGEAKPAETKSAAAEAKPESKAAASKPAKSDKPEKKSKK